MTYRITPLVKTPKGKVYRGTTVKLEPTDFERHAGGIGGWEVIDRPRRGPAVAWVGTPEETLELPVILNGVQPNRVTSVKRDRDRIESWGKKDDRSGEPPRLQVTGVMGIGSSTRWVLQDIERGPYWTNKNGTLIQQELTLKLLRWREPTLVRGPAKRAKARKPKKGKQ